MLKHTLNVIIPQVRKHSPCIPLLPVTTPLVLVHPRAPYVSPETELRSPLSDDQTARICFNDAIYHLIDASLFAVGYRPVMVGDMPTRRRIMQCGKTAPMFQINV